MTIQSISETPLIKTNIFKDKINSFEVYIKDESKNKFGTIKDRRNIKILQEASRLGVDKLALITSGNNGYSMAKIAETSAIKVVAIVNKNLSDTVKNLLKKICYQVIEINLEHKILRTEEIIAFAREKEDEVIWDITNGYEENYTSLVDEIVHKITPDYIIVPVGSGGIFVGVAERIRALGLQTKVIGVGVQNTSHSFADKLYTPWTPYANAIGNYTKMGHEVYRLSENEVQEAYKKYKYLVECEPSSSVVFSAIERLKFKKEDKIVFVNSGRVAIKEE